MIEDTRSEKVRKGSVVLFGSCVAEAPTGRCYGGNVLFGPSRPTPWPVPSSRENSESRREGDRERVLKSKSDGKFLPDDAIPLYPPWDPAIMPRLPEGRTSSSRTRIVVFGSIHVTRRISMDPFRGFDRATRCNLCEGGLNIFKLLRSQTKIQGIKLNITNVYKSLK